MLSERVLSENEALGVGSTRDQGRLDVASERFLRYLKAERNASELTIKSYREDLQSVVAFLQGEQESPPHTSQITLHDLRGYVGAMHEAGYAKSSVS